MSKFVSVEKKYVVCVFTPKGTRTTFASTLSEAKAATVGLRVESSVCEFTGQMRGILIEGSESRARKYSYAKPVLPFASTKNDSEGLAVAYRKRGLQPIRGNMLTPLQVQLWAIARRHGFRAKPGLLGGIVVMIPYCRTIENGVEEFPCHTLHQLKIALGY